MTVEPSGPIVVWCLVRDQRAHVEPVARHFGAAAEFLYDATWNPDELLRRRPDLVLCVNDFPFEIARCLDAARAAGIPSLVLQDGILEWRCQYENPLFGAGGGAPQHQPVLADRIACLGAQSARQIEAWGNEGRVVVTGMPRLDYLLERPRVPRRSPGARILVMTAKNPGFTQDQVDVTVRSMRDLKGQLDRMNDVTVVWRTAGKVSEELGVESEMRACASEELADILDRVDAVVTTPSTAMLEAMLCDRPVAALDYHNVPRFVPTAWTIAAPNHIAPVLSELLSPPARKMAHQRQCLEDCLRIDGPAAPRVAACITEMAGRRSSPAAKPTARPGAEASRPEPRTSLADLYPEVDVYRERDVTALQVRIARLEKTNALLEERLRHLGVSGTLAEAGRRLVRNVRGRAAKRKN